MEQQPKFEAAFGYRGDPLALPVTDLDVASRWYAQYFGMREVERREQPRANRRARMARRRDGQKLQVFFAVAPDGLCYYFHEPIKN